MDDLKRIFIAIPVPEEFKRNLSEQLAPLKESIKQVRWLDEIGWHISFIPPQKWNDDDVKMILSVLSVLGISKRFMLFSEKICLAPPHRTPRMIWCLFKKEPLFYSFLETAVNQIEKAGFILNNVRHSDFIHLTLARFHEGTRVLLADIPVGSKMTIDSIEIWESKLLPTGAIYTSLGRIELC